jgi:hypothetical protein
MTVPTLTQQWPNYRDMTPEQMLAWGAAEHQARMADLTDRTAEGLNRAQANCEVRRKAIGASLSAAASMVRDASVARRREQFRASQESA